MRAKDDFACAGGRQVGSVFVLPPQDAVEMIRYCQSKGIDVFGVEGFRIIGDRIQPQQEHSCDFGEEVSGRHERTAEFVAQRLGTDLWFEVITEEAP